MSDKKLRCVFIIPYFGRIPDYFHLWLKSAEANPDFTFYLYTDLPFPVSDESNVKIKYITFSDLQKKIREKLGRHCIVNDPYKLCDYKPAYGYLFAEDIGEFDFWGFCDIDLIWGNIGKVVTQEILQTHDKLFMHGHFCLMRNDPRMNLLFRTKHPQVVDFDYISRTNYSCHFDENGTIAYGPDNDPSIRFASPGAFYDPPSAFYPMMYQKSEVCAVWDNGTLTMYWSNAQRSMELFYIHLQKRPMLNIPETAGNKLLILRNMFFQDEALLPTDLLSMPIDQEAQEAYLQEKVTRRKKDLVRKFKTGALKFRFFRRVYRWKSR